MQIEPDDLPWLIDRPRVTALLAQRWQRRVTTVVAGAGFGKSTAIALAIRESAADPERTDHLIRLDASRGSAARFTQLLAETLGAENEGDPERIVAQLADRPGEHCLIFDDVHELPEGSAGRRALAAVLDHLPVNTGLVLLSRTEPPVPLARLRAAGQVIDITEAELGYDPDELRAVADATGSAVDELAAAGAWPALVSLIASRGHRGAWEFLAEEVLAELDQPTRDALAVAAFADGADAALLHQVAGVEAAPRSIATAVPLTTVDDAGRLVPHALWSQVLGAVAAPELLRELVDQLLVREEPFAALRVAVRLGDPKVLATVVRALCAAEFVGFDTASLSPLLAAAPPGFSELPEGRLLAAILAAHRDPMDEATRLALTASAREFRKLRLVDCEVVALSELAMVLRWQARSKRLLLIIRRLFVLAAGGHATAARLASFARAVIADREGDSEKSLAAVAELRRGHLQDGWIALVDFVRCHQLLNLGRIREAYDAAARSRELGLPGFHGGWCSAFSAEWHLGVTRARVDQLPFADEVPDASPIDQIWIGAWFGAMQAYAGRHEAAARNIAAAERALHARLDTQLVGFVVWARAAMAVAEHDEPRAREALRDYLRRHRAGSPLGRRLLVRAPAMAELLLGHELPTGWAQSLSGPWQQAMLEVAIAFRALRAGEPVGAIPEPGLVLCALPLPWAVEFAARAEQAGHPQAGALAELILEVSGPAARTEAERHLAPELQEVASRLFAGSGRSPASTAIESLTAAERRVLEEVTRGLTNQQIGAQLGISARTVANHLYSAYGKLGAASRTEAALLVRDAARAVGATQVQQD